MKLIVLDRDGVINHDSDNYIKSPEEFIPLAGSIDAIARLCHAGYTVVVATNQSGIARKLFDMATLQKMHDKLNRLLAAAGGRIEAIFFCPHGPDDHCDCRKPGTGMLKDIARRFQTNLHGVPVVGDSYRDVEAARAMGAQPVLVRTGKGERTLMSGKDLTEVPVFDDLAAYVDHLLNHGSR
jgi:D-glycero-D-manno-heptose 1,7-bisphosphate phosphatase